ncbi:MAG: hypothetical protein Q9226_003891 [Calogaya cf. arnoldii]
MEGEKAYVALKTVYDDVLFSFEEALDEAERLPPPNNNLRPTELIIWLENATTSLISWGIDIRANTGSLTAVGGLPLGVEVRCTLLELQQRLDTFLHGRGSRWMSSDPGPNKPASSLDSIKDQLLITDGDPMASMSGLVGDLQDLVRPVRMLHASQSNKGPYRSLKLRVDDLYNRHVNREIHMESLTHKIDPVAGIGRSDSSSNSRSLEDALTESSLSISSEDDGSAEDLWAHLGNTLRNICEENWHGAHFIGPTAFDQVMSATTVRRLFKSLSPVSKRVSGTHIGEAVGLRCSKILAICMYARIAPNFFCYLVECLVSDKQLPIAEDFLQLLLSSLPESVDQKIVQRFCVAQWVFLPVQFRFDQTPTQYESSAVLPIQCNTERDYLGHGVFGGVYRVRIRSEFQAVKTQAEVFAIKRLIGLLNIDTTTLSPQTVMKRIKRLDHPNLVQHVDFWVVGQDSYILFPLAARNLRQLLDEETPPSASTDQIRHGSSEAIQNQFLHNQKPSLSGAHMNLRPEKIQITQGDDGVDMWKLADFGLPDSKGNSYSSPDVSFTASQKGADGPKTGELHDIKRSDGSCPKLEISGLVQSTLEVDFQRRLSVSVVEDRLANVLASAPVLGHAALLGSMELHLDDIEGSELSFDGSDGTGSGTATPDTIDSTIHDDGLQAFGSGYPQIHLQSMTESGIEEFARDSLASLPFTHREPMVKLAVESLRRGYGNGDSSSEIERRLDEVPHTLEGLYHDMWNAIKECHRVEAMMSHQIISKAWAPLSLEAFIFAVRDQDLSEERSVKKFVDEETVKRWALRTPERTCGLLVVKESTKPGFLHYTAMEYLLTSHRQAEMQLATAKRGFDVNVALLRASNYQVQTLKSTTPDREEWEKTIVSAVNYAREAEQSTGQAQTTLLDSLDRVAGGVMLPPSTGADDFQPSITSAHWTAAIMHNPDDSDCDYCPTSFLEFAIMNGLTLYVATKLHQAKSQGTPPQPFLLLAATLAMVKHNQNIPQNYPQVQIVEKLLQSGASPNTKIARLSPEVKVTPQSHAASVVYVEQGLFSGKTPWAQIVEYLDHDDDGSHEDEWGQVCKLFLEYGADQSVLAKSRISSAQSHPWMRIAQQLESQTHETSAPLSKVPPDTFQCAICPQRFTRAYNLRSHLRTHTDERPFVCTVCGKAFARQHDRKRHEGLHSGEKKFVPKGCVYSSKRHSGNNVLFESRIHGRKGGKVVKVTPLAEAALLGRYGNAQLPFEHGADLTTKEYISRSATKLATPSIWNGQNCL